MSGLSSFAWPLLAGAIACLASLALARLAAARAAETRDANQAIVYRAFAVSRLIG